MLYAGIALPIPIDQIFDYIVSEDMVSTLRIGCRVYVPFGKGNRSIIGFCVRLQDTTQIEADKLKSIKSILDTVPAVNSEMLEFTKWWSQYYHCSLGESLAAVVPKYVDTKYGKKMSFVRLKKHPNLHQEIQEIHRRNPRQAEILDILLKSDQPVLRDQIRKDLQLTNLSPFKSLENKGIIEVLEQEPPDLFDELPVQKRKEFELTEEQKTAIFEIRQNIVSQIFQPFLLFGITGSGKTEVYLQTIETVIAMGKEAIVLVPEISLTPQTVIRFRERFSNVAVLHSELSDRQRSHQWHAIQQGKIQVVIGPRSAIFAPTSRLGLIIVDEEHEPSFKQQSSPRYHARDIAVKRAFQNKCPIILGSATPSLETYQNCLRKKYKMLSLTKRIGTAKLPEVHIVNMLEEYRRQKKISYFSEKLLESIRKVLLAHEQIILFINRRGFAPVIVCPICKKELTCPNCDIPLTYHKDGSWAKCHHCKYMITVPDECPACRFQGMRFLGIGTQRVETFLRKNFPDARIQRMDSDVMTSREQYEKIFLAFSRHEVDILLGTQMIAKGLDFPNVTLVGIIAADMSLYKTDFRSSERTFQLIVQVAGRSGRGEKEGIVVLQSLQPDHYAIQLAIQQNYFAFAEQELGFRQEFAYPPFGRLLRIVVEGEDEKIVLSVIQEIFNNLPRENCEILGPAQALIPKIDKSYRWNILIKSSDMVTLKKCAKIFQRCEHPKVSAYLDMDPISLY